MFSWLVLHMKKVTIAMLVALFGAAIAVLGTTPNIAFAQSSSSAASATDNGASGASSGARVGDGTSGAAAASGQDVSTGGGDSADCFSNGASFVDDGGCASAFRNPPED